MKTSQKKSERASVYAYQKLAQEHESSEMQAEASPAVYGSSYVDLKIDFDKIPVIKIAQGIAISKLMCRKSSIRFRIGVKYFLKRFLL